MHPWITRKLDGQIPRTNLEENIYLYEIDTKMRKVNKILSIYMFRL